MHKSARKSTERRKVKGEVGGCSKGGRQKKEARGMQA